MANHPNGSPRNMGEPLDVTLPHDAVELRTEVADGLARGRGRLTVDISAMEPTSSETVAALLWARRACTARQVSLMVRGAGPRTAHLLQLCGFPDEVVEGMADS